VKGEVKVAWHISVDDVGAALVVSVVIRPIRWVHISAAWI